MFRINDLKAERTAGDNHGGRRARRRAPRDFGITGRKPAQHAGRGFREVWRVVSE